MIGGKLYKNNDIRKTKGHMIDTLTLNIKTLAQHGWNPNIITHDMANASILHA